MSTKKLLPRAVAEKFFVSISSPLPAGMSLDCSRGSSLDCSSVSLGSFSSGDNVRRLLKLGKRSDFGNHGSIGGSWPMAISGSPRGHSVITVTRCRSTQGRTTYLILPSNRASQEPNRPPPRRGDELSTRDAQAACRCNSLASTFGGDHSRSFTKLLRQI